MTTATWTPKTTKCLAQADGIKYWQHGENVFRADANATLIVSEGVWFPHAAKWHCTMAAWPLFVKTILLGNTESN